MTVQRWLKNILISFDQLGNTFLFGSTDETISSRAYREWKVKGRHWACILCRLLDLIDKNHCEKSAGV